MGIHQISRSSQPVVEARPLRCAIYTRVSTEHGLDQTFNSLDAQRESCEAYIKSQAHEGWRCLADRYDDGGYSGGSMQRPNLQRLIEDIRAGHIDTIVVYKVDRLTRSLADFAKLVELFDANGVSFVSVTQAFNTTSSMGRLTLNVLLSFAQFEREVTGERIRDKIAASKRKGMRMGGPVPLGYEVKDKKLIVHEEEADRVRTIFRQYLTLRSLTLLARYLEEQGIVTKVSTLRHGAQRGGIGFTKGPLAYLLRNRTYIGEVCHKGRHYVGEHQPILDRALFDAVQEALTSTAHSEHRRSQLAAPLKGKIFDERGNRMTPITAIKNGVHYRYYVSSPLMQGRKEDAPTIRRISGPEIEALVAKALTEDQPGEDVNSLASNGDGTLFEPIECVTVSKGRIEIKLHTHNGEQSAPVIRIPWQPAPQIRREIITSPGARPQNPMRAETRARLLEGIAKGRAWLDELVTGQATDLIQIAVREHCSERSVRMTLNLAFLSPTIIRAAINGQLAEEYGVSRLVENPNNWSSQIGL